MTVTTAERAPKAKPNDACAMKLTLDRGDFFRALTHAASIVERANTIPVLSNVLLEARDGALHLMSTDLNMQVALTVPAMVESEGATTVSAQLLHGIVREMADGSQVDLTLGDRLQVRSGRSDYKLQTIASDKFPVLKPDNAKSTFVLPAADLLRSLKRVEFAQALASEPRDYLCGVHVETRDGELFFAATDGYAMGFSKLPAPKGADVASAILPTKLVTTLMKLLDGVDGDVRLFFDDRKAVFQIGSTILTGKLVEGTYPEWRRVLPPEEGSKRLLIGAETLKSALRRVTLVANEKVRAVKFELSKDKLTASCVRHENGVAVEEAPCVWDDGDFQIGFNASKLLAAIRASGADELQVDLIDAATPPLFSNPADESAKFIVMPMRV